MTKGIIIVVGGGFAGVSALNALLRVSKDYEIVLIDKKETSDFLPCLPDIVGRGVRPEGLTLELRLFCKRKGITFVNEEVISIDIQNHKVQTKNKLYPYDYLIAAPGTETNFYGNDVFAREAYTLGNVESAENILNAIRDKAEEIEKFIIAGGGYTGIEIATNLWRYFAKRTKKKGIIIVEKSNIFLGPVPSWMREYTQENLKRMGIEVLLNSGIQDIHDGRILLYPQGQYENAMLIWTAGVKTPDFIQDLPCSKGPQGRVAVDPYLRVDDKTYVLGDCAYIDQRRAPLRMAIQFSIAQGQLAARNIMNSIKKRPLRIYKPLDLGYIIPMANNRSCGQVFGVKLRGVVPTFLHYFMCAYRNRGLHNQWALVRDLAVPHGQ